MAFFPRNSDVAAQETRSPNIDMQTKDLVPRINDFGEVRYRAELPDDSGESTYQAELPDIYLPNRPAALPGKAFLLNHQEALLDM